MDKSYRVQWGVANSQWTGDSGVLYFENEVAFSKRLRQCESEAADIAKLEEALRALDNVSGNGIYISNFPVPHITDGFCVQFLDNGDLVELTLIERVASAADLSPDSDLRCVNGHLPGIDDFCDCGETPIYWIKEVADRKYVVREEWYLRPDED